MTYSLLVASKSCGLHYYVPSNLCWHFQGHPAHPDWYSDYPLLMMLFNLIRALPLLCRDS